MTRTERGRFVAGLLFCSPWIVGFFVWTAWPILASIYYSLCRFDGIAPPRFLGLLNYTDLLFRDDLFWKSLWNTMYFVVIGLPVSLLWSLGLALLLNLRLRGQSIYRTLAYLPALIPVVAASVIWLWLLNPEIGLINALLAGAGLRGPAWLLSPAWAKPALIIMGLWGAGGTILIYLAALQDVPLHLYEAARIDGAGPARQLWHVTLPMISPVVFFNVVMGLIGSFQYFTQVYVMTSAGGRPLGGPQDSTLVYALHLFANGFLNFRMGYASAMAWILFLITLAATALVFRTSARWVYYAGK